MQSINFFYWLQIVIIITNNWKQIFIIIISLSSTYHQHHLSLVAAKESTLYCITYLPAYLYSIISIVEFYTSFGKVREKKRNETKRTEKIQFPRLNPKTNNKLINSHFSLSFRSHKHKINKRPFFFLIYNILNQK